MHQTNSQHSLTSNSRRSHVDSLTEESISWEITMGCRFRLVYVVESERDRGKSDIERRQQK